MKASFLIRSKEPDIITEKGLRVFVMERLLNSSFEKGIVSNIDDKTVEVQIEGDKEQIIKFKEKLEKDVIAKFGNPVITFSDIQEITNDIPNLMKSSQALMVGQLQKGISVQLDILAALKNLPQELAKILK